MLKKLVLTTFLTLSACGPRTGQTKPTPAEQAIAQHEADAIRALLTGDIFPEMRTSACKQATESAKAAEALRRKAKEK